MSLELLEKHLHQPAWDRFVEMGLPTKQNEVYRYVRLKDLYSQPYSAPEPFKSLIAPEESTLVFANGTYIETLSSPPKGVIILPLSKAFATYGAFLVSRLNKRNKEEKDPFAALNGAYYTEGLFIYVPPKYVCASPIRMIHYTEKNSKPIHVCPRVHLFAGKDSLLQLTWEQRGPLERMWVNTYIDCALEEAASVTVSQVHDLPETAHHFLALRATLKSRSSFKSFSVTNGSATSREDYCVRLQGEAASVSLYGVWDLKEHRQHHVNLWIDHQEPSCSSLQKFKGILSDTSRSSFEGKIYVHSKAQKTQAYQMNNNLVLGDKAAANSKPNLEIFADDVKASHGATVGQIDPEHLFYLQARGIPLSMAQKLLVQGFRNEIIDLIPHLHLREKALRL